MCSRESEQYCDIYMYICDDLTRIRHFFFASINSILTKDALCHPFFHVPFMRHVQYIYNIIILASVSTPRGACRNFLYAQLLRFYYVFSCEALSRNSKIDAGTMHSRRERVRKRKLTRGSFINILLRLER